MIRNAPFGICLNHLDLGLRGDDPFEAHEKIPMIYGYSNAINHGKSWNGLMDWYNHKYGIIYQD
jgi:hypothetical protein